MRIGIARNDDFDRRARILIVCPGIDEARRGAERVRFGAMVDALHSVGIASELAFVGSAEELGDALARTAPDIAFCSFFRFDDGRYLREQLLGAGVAWIGSPSEVMELALSKTRMKERWRAYGIPTPDWHAIRKNADGSVEGIEFLESMRSFPYIVKPANEGNSRGIDPGSIVRTPLELSVRAGLVAEKYGDALIERFVAGGEGSREFTAAMIGNGPSAIVGAVEIHKPASGISIVTEADKEKHTAIAARIGDDGLEAKVEGLARRVFMSAWARDYARCDILLHEKKLYAIEMNGQPMLPDRWFEACAREAGLDARQCILAVFLAGIVGNARTGHAFIEIPGALEKALPRSVYEQIVR